MSKFFKWFRIIVCQWLASVLILVILVLSLWNCADYWRTANWIRTDGTIINLKITNFDGSEPGSNWSGNGKLLCQYAYTFEGRNYSGDRIGVETFDDSSRRFRRYRQLKAQFDEQKPVTVWFNPAAPMESALFREQLSEMYFGPTIGFLWFGALFWNHKRGSKKSEPPK
jgi:hypothetical protein